VSLLLLELLLLELLLLLLLELEEEEEELELGDGIWITFFGFFGLRMILLTGELGWTGVAGALKLSWERTPGDAGTI
jgi:hypothetical protein